MAINLGIADLDEWADNQLKAYDLTKSEQARITKAGADVLKNALNEYLKKHHYQNHKTGASIHLADSVISQAVNVQGDEDGTSTVGFGNKKAFIARFLSDGTKYIQGDNFLDKVRNDNLDEIFEAENKMYQKIIKQKGVDNT